MAVTTLGQRNQLDRPSLDFQYIFDVCAMESRSFPVLIHADHGFYAYELARRLTTHESTALLTIHSPLWILVSLDQVVVLESDALINYTGQIKTFIWAEPTDSAVLNSIKNILSPDAAIQVIISRRLAGMLTEAREAIIPQARLGAKVISALRHAGFKVDRQLSFHGLLSIFWWQVANFCNRFNRPDLADRCWYKMRESFPANGWQTPLSAVSLLFVRKES